MSPPCVVFCLIATWCNAWCTGRRFQDRSGKCHLCSWCDGEDSLEHYVTCNYHWEVFTNKLRKYSVERSLEAFLVLGCCSTDDKVFHACHVYAVKRAVDIRRKGGVLSSCQQAYNLVWQGHQNAALYHSALNKRYMHIWA